MSVASGGNNTVNVLKSPLVNDIVVAVIEAVITAEADNNAKELLITWSVVVK